jgi:hypothetical protein
MTHYTIDRAPETVARLGHPEIIAWGALQAARGYVAQDRGHRSRISKTVAGGLVRLYYGKALDVALSEGVI